MPEAKPNPYHYQTAIEEPGAFFGRAAQIEVAREHIESKECISFVGEPRSGLTSLLNRLTQEDFCRQCEAQAGALRFVRVDCIQFDEPLCLIQYLITQIVPNRPMPNLAVWGRAFSRLITLLRSLDRTRVVVLFDNFECMGSSERFVEFLDVLRAAVPQTEMTLITTTHKELHKCCHERVVVSPFPNIFNVRYLGAFSREEAVEFLKVTSEMSGVDLVSLSGSILKLSGRLPYFLQMACWHYYQAVVGGNAVDHAAIAAQFAAEARPEFECIWQRLDGGERKILKELARGEQAADALNMDLVAKGYIAEGDIFSSAFRDFLQEVS